MVNLTTPQSYAQQLAQAEYQQKIAQMLQEQANAPIDIQSYKGTQAPIPMTAILAKALQGFGGAYMARQGQQGKIAAEKSAREDTANQIKEAYSPVTTPGSEAVYASPSENQIPISQGPTSFTAGLEGMGRPGMPYKGVDQPDASMAPGVPLAAALANSAPSPQNENGPEAQARANADRMRVLQQTGAPGQSAPQMGTPFPLPPAAGPRLISAAVAPTSRPRTAAEQMDIATRMMSSDIPGQQAFGTDLMGKAVKNFDKERMVNAIKSVDIGKADPAVLNLYIESGDLTKGIDYLAKFGLSEAEATAKLQEIKLRIMETSGQREADRELRRDMADQASADRRFGISQASADRQERARDRQTASGLINDRQIRNTGTQYRKEFDALPEVKNYRTIDQQFNNIKSAAAKKSPAGDVAIIFEFMKALDPTSVVRESEQATARNAGAIPDKIRNLYNKALKGESLAPEQRQDFVNQAGSIRNNSRARFDTIKGNYISYANEIGIDPKMVIGESDAVRLGSNPDADFAKLPSGAVYIGPDGVQRTK